LRELREGSADFVVAPFRRLSLLLLSLVREAVAGLASGEKKAVIFCQNDCFAGAFAAELCRLGRSPPPPLLREPPRERRGLPVD